MTGMGLELGSEFESGSVNVNRHNRENHKVIINL